MRRAGSAGWLLLALSSVASAHVASADAVGFVSGLRHPVSGADHILAMIAVGLWGAQLGPPGIWLLPLTFPLVMALGGFLGLLGVSLPAAQVAIALSGICLGGCVMAQLRPPLWVAGVLVGSFGLFHGYAHGVELQQGEDALLYSIGFVVATGLLHAVGVALGVVHRWGWGRQALRGAGMIILGGGLYFMWTAVA
jgi:urease accessory protein